MRSMRYQKLGHIYHVICRGTGLRPLFLSDQDRNQYLAYLNESREQFSVKIFNYVLMDHYIHLLLEPQEEESLSKFMELVSKKYAKYFNKKYKAIGHVFLRRYKNFVVQEEKYFLACSRHIDLDPVKEKIAKDPADYVWSGFNQLASGKVGVLKLDHHKLYEDLGKNDTERKLLYKTLVVKGLLKNLDVINFRGQAIGDREFRDQFKKR